MVPVSGRWAFTATVHSGTCPASHALVLALSNARARGFAHRRRKLHEHGQVFSDGWVVDLAAVHPAINLIEVATNDPQLPDLLPECP